jgi:hypothetical protein
MNEKRASMIGKLKSVEKEVEGLAAKKEVAEAYLSKQVGRAPRAYEGGGHRNTGWIYAGLPPP